MGKKKIIISKDALCKDYLHFYGTRMAQQDTPNLDALVSQGTLFTNYYTAAPSTVMSFYSMATGKFAHETDFEMYERAHLHVPGETIFTKAKSLGYHSCHVIWDSMWDVLPQYYDYFRDDVTIHSVHELRESVGVHKKSNGCLFSDNVKAQNTLARVEELLKSILFQEENAFIWLHLPHVLSGRACYGADIELFDQYVGMVRKYIPDECIIITADHGNMNGLKGKLAYGFDVYDKVANIPLIVPRIDGQNVCEKTVSSVDLYSIVFEKTIPYREFIYCDSAYRAQKHRKLAIVYKNFKYIYNKRTDTEELYDLQYDPDENLSLISDDLFDVDRKIKIKIHEEYFYPRWQIIPQIRECMRAEKERVWKNGSIPVIIKSNVKDMIRPLYELFLRFAPKYK